MHNSVGPGFYFGYQIQSLFHRIVEVGRYLWASAGSTPLLKWGYSELVGRTMSGGLFTFQGWRLHNLSGQPVPGLSPSQ